MKVALLVAMGGAAGALSRWLVVGWVDKLLSHTKFPGGLLLVNVLGSFVLGLVYGILESRDILSDYLRFFLALGFLGSFTTYSSFSYATLDLIRHQQMGIAVANVVIHVILGLLAAWLGFRLCVSPGE